MIRIEKPDTSTAVPNLYQFATKELAQDATLAYILAWASPEYRESHSRLHELGTAMLRALLATNTKINEADIPAVTSLEVQTQFYRIDVLALINDENKNGHVLLIEDKVGTHEHSNQIERYIETAEERYPNREIVPVYVKTGNTSRAYLPDKEKCGCFLRQDILEVLNQHPGTGDTIIDNFRVYLQDWENETNSYCDVRFSEWVGKWSVIEGFYMELEKQMTKEKERWLCDDSWGYVNNATGGFLYFTFASKKIKRRQQEFDMYFQIEAYPDKNRTRLTLRLGDWSGPGIKSPLMWEVFDQLLKESAGKSDDLGIKKAGRFRGGYSAAVAEFTFGDKNGYIALDDRDVVDLETTMERLDRVRRFVDKLSHRLHVPAREVDA